MVRYSTPSLVHLPYYERKEEKSMMKNKIRLDTMCDVNRLVSICATVKGEVHLTDKRHFCVNAKSLLGVMYSLEFDEVWIESEEDIYSKISEFVINE